MNTENSSTPTVVKKLPFSFAKRNGVILSSNSKNKPLIIFRAGVSPSAMSEAIRMAGDNYVLESCTDDEFEAALNGAYEKNSSETMQMVEGIGDDLDLTSLADSVPETEDLLEQEDDAPIIRLINAILTEAIKEGASDIHIETYERDLIARFRVDGVLREVVRPKRALAPLLVSRIKVMAKMDIAEKRVPQDGRIALRIAGRDVDVRVSTMPSSQGERVVMRLLDKRSGSMDLKSLGMTKHNLDRINQMILRPHGIVIVTGPTGSGKSTTLYAGLQSINDRSKNILTVEDPIEYDLPGIGQTQVNTKVDMTFARGLRAILRQDPDVVMIGEIRDLETAEIAVQASLTGHLVLSTLHTNTAVGAVTRLIDMGIEPFLISSSLVGVIAQRLVRVLCEDCKVSGKASVAECSFLGVDPEQAPVIYHAKGCENCNDLGYKGRKGIYEVVEIDEGVRQLIHQQANEKEIENKAREKSPSIHSDGVQKILEGVTTIEEVMRVTHRSQ